MSDTKCSNDLSAGGSDTNQSGTTTARGTVGVVASQEVDQQPAHQVGTASTEACKVFRPDHNGECLNCDDWMDAHTPEAIEAGERAAKSEKP